MKELSIKEKAKCYDKALEKAKEKYITCYSPILLEYIFPELKENKDKEIRKDIIRNLERYIKCMKDGYDVPSAKDFVKEIEKQIAWLEKQGEQKQDVNVQINPSEYVNDMGGNGCYLKNATQTSTWSKKDEKMFEYALNMIEWYSGKNEDKSRFVSDWLKSIKQRIGG